MASDERVDEIRARRDRGLCIDRVEEGDLLSAYDRVKAERDAAIKRAEEAEGRLRSMELAYSCRWCGVKHLGGPENCKE